VTLTGAACHQGNTLPRRHGGFDLARRMDRQTAMSLMPLIQTRPEVAPGTPVLDAIRVMTNEAVGAVAVTEGDKLVGIFTERDVMSRVVLPRREPATTQVREVMSTPVHTVPVAASVAHAAALMHDHHVRHLAVLDADDDFVGVVGIREIMYELAGRLGTRVDDLEAFIMTDGPGG
jgi:CBS domain-containing protein